MVDLTWSAPSDCPPAAAFEAEVERLLEGVAPPVEPLPVRIAIAREGNRFRLEVATAGPGGEGRRSLEATSCEALVQAGALVVALAIDPELVAARLDAATVDTAAEADGTSEPRTRTDATDPPMARNDAPSEASLRSSPRPDLASALGSPTARAVPDAHFLAAAAVAIGVGPLPAASPGSALALGARLGGIDLFAGGVFLAEQEARVPGGADARGVFGLAFARFRACLAFALGGVAFELAPCIAFEAGSMWGRGVGVPRAQTGSAPWLTAEAGLEARWWMFDGLAMILGADLLAPFVRPDFVVDAPSAPVRVHDASPVGLLAQAGVIVRAP